MKTFQSIVLFSLIYFYKNIFAFIPSGRGEHNAVLIDKRLYFHGGSRWGEGHAPDQLFYLDVSKSFTTYEISLMPWTNLSSISGVTCRNGATACADETTIYYIGGCHCGGLVSKFDTISLQCSEPTNFGSIPREEMQFVQCAILGHNIICLCGAQLYSATLLNDSILCIGGKFGSVYACQTNSNQELPISIFNINNNTWRIITTSGQIPTKKCDHASVYIPQHNRILLFYGLDDITINSLDTLTFTWTIPVILNSGGPPRRLTRHTATLIGAYVLIAFLTIYDPINSIQPIPTSPTSQTSPTSPSNISIGVAIASSGIIGMIIGGGIMGCLRSIIERANINRVNYDRLP
ncbi:galactose oxidase [Gigaspora margarita]|uniref:Galactose oxidase n=1 Tax=Gigaspora margarita TaxID=4874 RepID=A0A8H3XCU1_GIGMA|nr:galactose oxidase [Gigaspora margarita]